MPGTILIAYASRAGSTADVWTAGDHRDWDAIRAWADELTVKLHA